MKVITTSRLAGCIFQVGLLLITSSSHALEPSQFATPTPDGRGYTINYSGISAAATLSSTQKHQIVRSLLKGEGHVTAGIESIAGLSATCKVYHHKHTKIASAVGCTLSATPEATEGLAALDGLAASTAICLLVDSIDGEITAGFCDVLVEGLFIATLEPTLKRCAQTHSNSTMTVHLDIFPPEVRGTAKCS